MCKQFLLFWFLLANDIIFDLNRIIEEKKIFDDGIDKQIKYYEKKLAEYPLDEYYKNNLKEYKEKKGKSFDISTNVEKIGDNAYKITEKINNFGSSQVKTTYVKILKEGVYIIGDSDTKDIFEGIFKNW